MLNELNHLVHVVGCCSWFKMHSPFYILHSSVLWDHCTSVFHAVFFKPSSNDRGSCKVSGHKKFLHVWRNEGVIPGI